MKEKWRRILRIIRKFFRDTALISVVSLMALIVSIITTFSKNNAFFIYFQNICYSVIAAYIFYIIQVYVPEYKRGNLIAVRLKGFFTGKILDNLNHITSMLNQKGEGISIEDAEYIVEAGAEAYDNIFRCIDFYSGSIEIELFDTLIGLSENQFLYNLYYAYHYETEKEYINWIDCLFHDESSVEFLKLKEKIKILNDELPLYENKTINKTND